MKKLLVLSLFTLLFIGVMFAQGTANPRTVYQEIILDNGANPPLPTGTAYGTNDPHYYLQATHVESAVTWGSGSAMPMGSYFFVSHIDGFGYFATFDQAAWGVDWASGTHLLMKIWYRDNVATPWDFGTMPVAEKTIEVPAGIDFMFLDIASGNGWIVPPYGPTTTTYTLNVNGPDGHVVTGPVGGTTDYVATDANDTTNDLIGTYTIDACTTPNYHWLENPIIVEAADFVANTATIEFVCVPDDNYTYNLNVTAIYQGGAPIIGTVVNGPAPWVANTGDIVTVGPIPTPTNTLLGNWTIGVPPPGYTWQVNPILVEAGDFVAAKSATNLKAIQGTRTNGAKTAYVYNATIQFVAVPIPLQPTLTVNSNPAGAAIWKDGVNTTQVTPWTFNPGEAGTYTLVLAGYTFDPIVVPALTENTTINFVGTMTSTGNEFLAGTVAIVGLPAGIPDYVQHEIGTGYLNVLVMRPSGISDTTPWYCWILDGATPRVLHSPGEPGQLPPPNPLPAGTASYLFTNIYFGATKGGIDVIVDTEDLTLPVELSSFTATTTAQNFVKLTWVSESETGLLGYRVYRNQANNQAGAISITPTMVPATNTSTTQTYSIVDNEVAIGSMYWYWLESVDMGHSTFHGPVSVLVEGEVPPVLPEYTTMRNAYPNPFKANTTTTIEVSVKAGETGTVSVYNILGQVVKTFSVKEGLNPLTWNGRDAKGNVCGSGIYFYKLSTPSMNQTKKMVIVK